MPTNLFVESGASAYADSLETLSDAMFGARYVSYYGINRFLDQIDDLNVGMIVWPGGTLAETRPDRYGFDFDGLQNPANNKPDLSEMMSIAVDQGAELSVILPTVRYANDLSGLQADLSAFLGDLLAGDFGPLPEKLTFEIGSEYYAHFQDGASTSAAQYGAVADLMISEIAMALADPATNIIGADIFIAVQSGKTLADDVDIRGAMSPLSLDNVDMLIHHRFAYQPQGIDERIAEYQDVLDSWEAETGEEPNLFVSAWNTVGLTRNGVLDDYVEYKAAQGVVIDPNDVDLDGRTTTEFENFWQDALDDVAYGQEHAAYLLESFASYAEAGADASAVFGTDAFNPGRLSWREDGVDHGFVGNDMMAMIHESVGGTHVLASDGDYDPNAAATTYGFENDDKLILFVAAGEMAPGEVALSLEGLGTTYTQVWAERLTSEVPTDWMNLFDVPDNAAVDETNEGETYAYGVREALSPGLEGGALTFSLDSSHEVIRLSFAKTAAGAHEIAGWSEGAASDLSGLGTPPILPDGGPLKDDMIHQDDDGIDADDLAMLADAVGAGGGMSLLLALLFLL